MGLGWAKERDSSITFTSRSTEYCVHNWPKKGARVSVSLATFLLEYRHTHKKKNDIFFPLFLVCVFWANAERSIELKWDHKNTIQKIGWFSLEFYSIRYCWRGSPVRNASMHCVNTLREFYPFIQIPNWIYV